MPTMYGDECGRGRPTRKCKHCRKGLHMKPLYCDAKCQEKYRADKR